MRRTARLITIVGAAIASALVSCKPAASPPTVETCSALPVLDNHREPDAVTVLLRLENKMGPSFLVDAVCISVGGRRIRQDDAAAIRDGFAAHRPLEMSVMLRPGSTYDVNVVTSLVGRGPAEGYKLSVSSYRQLDPEDLKPETVTATFLERGGPTTPFERRPTVEWSGPGHSPRR